MQTARDTMLEGSRWTDENARRALPLLLMLAKTRGVWTYGELNRELVRRYKLPPRKSARGYGPVLSKIASAIDQLSAEWEHRLPPLTILIRDAGSGDPNEGFDEFLQRYVSAEQAGKLTEHNRHVLVERATEAVYRCEDWDAVAAYFDVTIPTHDASEAKPIALPLPGPLGDGESEAHAALKRYVAAHPELFADFGSFGPGTMEALLLSGDEVDVLFASDDQTLGVEVKTGDAAPGELTRGLYQCVKYRAVLQAMHAVKGELKRVQVVLVTPQALSVEHQEAAGRLAVKTKKVKLPTSAVKTSGRTSKEDNA
jgi:hypothetical protein